MHIGLDEGKKGADFSSAAFPAPPFAHLQSQTLEKRFPPAEDLRAHGRGNGFAALTDPCLAECPSRMPIESFSIIVAISRATMPSGQGCGVSVQKIASGAGRTDSTDIR